jgi:NADH-quinone oxidoreductase subunit D
MKKKINNNRLQTIILNFGPQHPAAHGILKVSLALSGEVILRCDPQFGLLHRGSEKLIESKTILQSVPYLDRMDYVANIIQEHSFVLAFENSFLLKKKKINLLL